MKDVTEYQAALQVEEFRMNSELYEGPAYETVSAIASNAALPHYVPDPEGAKIIDDLTPYLIDTGGHYQDGTCSTTRTVHFGRPTIEQSEAYTRVLQGHIALSTVVFPEGTPASRLDILARKALWQRGMNYGHSTGDGVGSFLSAREAIVGFDHDTPLQPGHTISNQPGYYIEGQFGVRIESTLAVTAVQTPYDSLSPHRRWLGFKRLTQVPIQTKMVRASLLSPEEREWIRRHNQDCLLAIEPLLLGDKRTLKWLRKECQATFLSEKKGFLQRRRDAT